MRTYHSSRPARPRWPRRSRRLAALLAAFVLLAASSSGDLTASESSVKSAFLYNFARLVTWPAAAWSGEAEPFTVVVLGPDPLGTAVDKAFDGKTLGSRPFLVRRAAAIGDIGSCHLLYLNDAALLPKALEAVRGRAVLVVGEGEGLARRGAAIAFYAESTGDGLKIRFEINPDVTNRSGLGVSSKLLALACVVRDRLEDE